MQFLTEAQVFERQGLRQHFLQFTGSTFSLRGRVLLAGNKNCIDVLFLVECTLEGLKRQKNIAGQLLVGFKPEASQTAVGKNRL